MQQIRLNYVLLEEGYWHARGTIGDWEFFLDEVQTWWEKSLKVFHSHILAARCKVGMKTGPELLTHTRHLSLRSSTWCGKLSNALQKSEQNEYTWSLWSKESRMWLKNLGIWTKVNFVDWNANWDPKISDKWSQPHDYNMFQNSRKDAQE